MKRRNILLLGFSLAGLFGIGLSSLGSLASDKPLIGMNASEQTYKFLFDKSSNKPVKDGNGSLNVLSSLGNSFRFDYSSFLVSEGIWGKLATGGTLLNPYTSASNNNAIGKISSINVVFAGELTIDYGWDGKDETVNYLRTNHKLTSGVVFGFAAEMPNYIRIKATSETTITSITLNYRCGTNNNFNEAFQIKDIQSLKNFAALTKSGQTNLNARLVNDIDFKNATFSGIGTNTNRYKGTFDGNGKTISNIKIVNNTKGTGLFNHVEGATISNLNIKNVTVNSNEEYIDSSSALVGCCYGGKIDNINIISGTIYGRESTGSVVGCAYSASSKTTVNNVRNSANVIGQKANGTGGIVGANATGAIVDVSNSTNYGSVTNNNYSYAGGIIGLLRTGTTAVKPTITNCTNYGAVTAKSGVGGIAGLNRGSITNCKVGSTSIINDKVPSSVKNISGTGGYILGVNDTGGGAITNDEIAKYNYSPIWDPTTTKTAFVGSGTQTDPYKIEYAEDLNYLANEVNKGTDLAKKYFSLVTNIDLGSSNWTTIGIYKTATTCPFKGYFDGKNLKVDGLKIAKDSEVTGLFGYVVDAKISNINLINADVTCNKGIQESFAGVLAGKVVRTTVSNVTANGTIVSKGGTVGGIIGGAFGGGTSSISNCESNVTVTSSMDYAGGIIGGNKEASNQIVNITNCINKGNISSREYAGGITGILRREKSTATKSVIDGCTNYGNIKVDGSINSKGESTTLCASGIAGLNRGIVKNAKIYEDCTLTAGKTSKFAKECEPSAVNKNIPSSVCCNDTNPAFLGEINGYSLIKEDGTSFAIFNAKMTTGYGRIIKLSDGSYFSTDGVTKFSGKTLSSLENGQTIENDFKDKPRDKNGNEIEKSKTTIKMANAQPVEYAKGKIAVFYRFNDPYFNNGVGKYSSIRARISTDNGKTFGEPQILLENITKTANTTESEGLYEPFPVLKDDGNIELFISCDITSTVNVNDSLVATGGKQNIIRMPISVSNDTFTVGKTTIINNLKGTRDYARPGMTTISKLNDGSYIMAMERTNNLDPNTTKIVFTICISYSKDLINWTLPKEIIRPKTTNSVVTENYRCQSPCIGVLDNGKIAVSYMSNENFQGDNYINGNSFFRRCEVAISEKEVKYSDSPAMIKQDNSFGYGSNIGCQYPGLYVEGNTAYTIERTYAIAVNDSGNVSLSNKKTVIKPFAA
ncbi:MAG: hypothetical protein PUJ84_00825 [Mollicutes bacterium]|nr:hypothetical protein [Mollicutes bacterium]